MRSLSDPHAAALAVICERILPPGPPGPSVHEAGVLDYIDGQLDGEWGRGARMYREAPFLAAQDVGHGWQSAHTPAEAYAAGLAAIERHAVSRFRRPLPELEPAEQDAIVEAWARGEVEEFTEIDGVVFFHMVRRNILEGLFADPSYGGNRDMVGWRWLGFPGVPSAEGAEYAEQIARHDEAFVREPRGLDSPAG